MKKVLIIFLLIMIIPLNIKAQSLEDFDFTGEKIYDYAEILDEQTENSILSSMNEFTLKSGLSINLITVNTKSEMNCLISRIYEINAPMSFRQNNEGIVIIYIDQDDYSIVTLSDLEYNRWQGASLTRFETNLRLAEGGTIYDTQIDLFIDDLSDYFHETNIEIILYSIVIAFILTFICLQLMKRKYNIYDAKEAYDYINLDKIIVK